MLPSEYIQKGWERIAFARRQDGAWAEPNDPEAVSWCCYGALEASLGEKAISHHQMEKIRSFILKQTNTFTLSSWNARQETSEPIIAMLQAAEKAVL